MSEQRPDLERLLSAPEEAERVPVSDVPGLLARLAAEQLQLAGLQAALLARLHAADSASSSAEQLLGMEAVARILDVPPAHAYEMGRRHELPIVKVGRYVKVRESSLRTWLKQREELDTAPARAYHPRPKQHASRSGRVVPLRQPDKA